LKVDKRNGEVKRMEAEERRGGREPKGRAHGSRRREEGEGEDESVQSTRAEGASTWQEEIQT